MEKVANSIRCNIYSTVIDSIEFTQQTRKLSKKELLYKSEKTIFQSWYFLVLQKLRNIKFSQQNQKVFGLKLHTLRLYVDFN